MSKQPRWPGLPRIKRNLPKSQSCHCRRFYLSLYTPAWDDDWGWRHTKKKCGPLRAVTTATGKRGGR